MGISGDTSEFSERELADLSALADGTLDPARQDEVRSRIAASPELTALYERERRVVGLLHEVRSTDRAPAALRERIEASQQPAPKKDRPWTKTRWHFNQGGLVAGMAAAAVIVLALVLILPGGTGSPSVSEAAALATRAPTSVATVDTSQPLRLDANVQDVYFPNWATTEDWKAVGQRSDKLDGHSAVTVFYEKSGMRIAYTIVSAPPLKNPNATWHKSDNPRYLVDTLGGRQVVTWRAGNNTCVLSAAAGSTVPAPGLVSLAENS